MLNKSHRGALTLVATVATVPALGQLDLVGTEQEARALGCYTTNFRDCDESSGTYDYTEYPTRNAYASSVFYRNYGDGDCGGTANANFSTESGTGATIAVAHDLYALAEWAIPFRSGDATAGGYSQVKSTINFRRTAWFWYDGDINIDPGQRPVGQALVKLNLPGHNGYTHSISNGIESWAIKDVLLSDRSAGGTVIMYSNASISALADDPNDDDDWGTPDSAFATSYADACFVECFADWNRDRTVNTMDLTAFLNDWNAGHPDADLNGDGVINTQDVTVFLGAYAAGNCVCPGG